MKTKSQEAQTPLSTSGEPRRWRYYLASLALAISLPGCGSHVTPPSGGPPLPLEQRLEGFWKINTPLTPELEQAGVADVLDFETLPGEHRVRRFGYCGRHAINTGTFNIESGLITTDTIWDNDPANNHRFTATITRLDPENLELNGQFQYHRVHPANPIAFEEFGRRGGGFCAYRFHRIRRDGPIVVFPRRVRPVRRAIPIERPEPREELEVETPTQPAPPPRQVPVPRDGARGQRRTTSKVETPNDTRGGDTADQPVNQ